MTTIINLTVAIIQIIVLLTILVVIMFRLYRGRFHQISLPIRFTFLLFLATDSFFTIYLLTYYFVNTPYSFGTALGFLTSALIVAFCLGGIAPIDRKRSEDDAWRRYLKERNEWEEERRKRELADEE